MSKNIKIAALGIAAFATAAAPMMAMAAENEFVDNISITIDKTCTLTRATAAHAAEGENHGTWDNSTDTLSKTLVAGTAVLDLGSSNFKVVCNNTKGYKVTMAAEGLTSGTDTIDYITTAAAPTTAASEWGVKVGSAWKLSGDIVDTTNAPLTNSGKDFTVIYGVAIKDGQAAGTYAGKVTYTLAQLNS